VPRKVDEKDLYQHWVHSHEEDTATEKVFRPARYSFPRSRGRASFELKPDGTLIERRIGPTDRGQEVHGVWKLQGEDQLAFYQRSETQPYRAQQIISVDKDRMIIAR
jgi:hypothetical protein